MAETARENVVVCDNGTGVSVVLSVTCLPRSPRQRLSHWSLCGVQKGDEGEWGGRQA